MPSRNTVRDFPGRRGVLVVLRTLHLVGVVLVGAALFGEVTSDIGLRHGATLLLLSGAGMFLMDIWACPAVLREAAGVGVIVKLLLLATVAIHPGWANYIFWTVLVLSTLLSHASRAVRHRRLF